MEDEVRVVQIGEVDILECDRAAVPAGQVDHDIVPVLCRREVGECVDILEGAQIDPVLPIGEVLDRVRAVVRPEDERVGALFDGASVTPEDIVAEPADNGIDAGRAVQGVVAGSAVELVAAGAAIQGIVARVAKELVIAGAAKQQILAFAPCSSSLPAPASRMSPVPPPYIRSMPEPPTSRS